MPMVRGLKSLGIGSQVVSKYALEIKSLSHVFGSFRVLDNIDLQVLPGQIVAVVGPSGCGKSTLLNMAAGLMAPTEGTVEIFGQPLTGINRQATYMFQQDALLPWKNVLDNILLGLTLRRISRA